MTFLRRSIIINTLRMVPYQRLILDAVEQAAKSGLPLLHVMIGPRQVGKSTAAAQLVERLGWPAHYAAADAPPDARCGVGRNPVATGPPTDYRSAGASGIPLADFFAKPAVNWFQEPTNPTVGP